MNELALRTLNHSATFQAAAKSKGGFLPEQLAYQFSRVTKQLGNLSRPSYQPETEEDKSDAKSLFHEKLFEKNRSLKTTIDRYGLCMFCSHLGS